MIDDGDVILDSDIDECTSKLGICGNGTCRNTEGGYVCECYSGYQLGANGNCFGELILQGKSAWRDWVLLSRVFCRRHILSRNAPSIQFISSVYRQNPSIRDSFLSGRLPDYRSKTRSLVELLRSNCRITDSKELSKKSVTENVRYIEKRNIYATYENCLMRNSE